MAIVTGGGQGIGQGIVERFVAAALFPAGDDASFVTGIDLPVDAGWNAH